MKIYRNLKERTSLVNKILLETFMATILLMTYTLFCCSFCSSSILMLLISPIYHCQMSVVYTRGGGGILTLTWYTYMCLPFRALFCYIWYSDQGVSSEMKEPKLHKLGVIWANYCEKHPIWSKLGAFLSKMYILMGGKLGKKLVLRKSDFQGPASTSMYSFCESNLPGGLRPGEFVVFHPHTFHNEACNRRLFIL